MERLQKVMARAGVASRRRAEMLIREGRVRVNGQVVTQMGALVEPRLDRITVDGRPIPQAEPFFYYALYKPRGYVTTVRDERGRPTVMDLLAAPVRLYPVGRLDLDSEGLLLLTNDGDLANRLIHPRYVIDKEYRVLVAGRLTPDALEALRLGVPLEDGVTAPATVEPLRREGQATWFRFVIHVGRKRQIRRMVRAVGGHVLRLIRVRIDGVALGRLKPGQWRQLTAEEVRRLRGEVD